VYVGVALSAYHGVGAGLMAVGLGLDFDVDRQADG
jgi:hypothetical protein